MKRKSKEQYIDKILDHTNSLTTLYAVQSLCNRKIENRLKIKNRSHEEKQDLECLFLLQKRINIVIPSYIEDAQIEQGYLLNPEYTRTDAGRYRQLCSFKISVNDLCRVKGYDKLKSLGMYNKVTNPNGVVKDHRLSIHTGFTGKLNPKLMGHPCNCEFLTMKENSIKSSNDSIDINTLHSLIAIWEGKTPKRWKEFN